jgi:hypothetical protein
VVTVVVKGADKALANLDAAIRDMPRIQERAVSKASVLLSKETRLQLTGQKGNDTFFGVTGAPAPHLGVRTGQTRSRITPGGIVFRHGNTVFSVVGSPDRHVLKHEEGGTILGRQFLRIPLAAAQTPAGAERGEFAGRSLRDVPGVFLRRSKAGNLLAWRSIGGGKLEALYLLVRSVTLPARGMFKAVRERVTPEVNAIVGGEVAVLTRKASGG